jgi:hypothetical protein
LITLRDWTYAEPLAVAGPEDGCNFYHWMDLPNFPSVHGYVTVPGAWDLRGRFQDYVGGVEVAGRSVLDVGTATGWISFEAERLGASQIVGLDAADDVMPQSVPYFQYEDRDQAARTTGGALVSNRTAIRRSYWHCHKKLGSSAKVVYGDIYRIGEHISGAEIVVVGQILVHQRDPLEALLQCARVAEDTLIIVEGSFDANQPVMRFCGLNGLYYSWFLLSSGMYVEYLKILGFEVTSITKNLYRCAHSDAAPEMEIWTYVAKRVGPTRGRQRNFHG